MAGYTRGTEMVCSLTDRESRERRATVRKSLFPHLLSAEKMDSGLKLTFPDSNRLRSSVEDFVDLERQCCGFLTCTITPSGQGLTLTIEGPPEAQETLEKFSAAVETFVN